VRMKASAYLTPAFIRSHHTYENHRGVSMAEPAKNRMRDNVSEPLDRACGGRVLPERNVSSHLIIIGSVFRKNSPKVLCVEHDK
jgi:hypothetical protein